MLNQKKQQMEGKRLINISAILMILSFVAGGVVRYWTNVYGSSVPLESMVGIFLGTCYFFMGFGLLLSAVTVHWKSKVVEGKITAVFAGLLGTVCLLGGVYITIKGFYLLIQYVWI